MNTLPLSIQGVVFDGDGTVFEVEGSIGLHYSTFFNKYNISCTPEDIDDVLPALWKSFQFDYLDSKANYKTDCQREEQLWKSFVRMVAEHFCESVIPEDLLHEIYSHFSTAESRKIHTDVFETVQYLRQHGIVTALLTNNDLRTHTLLNALGMRDCFNFILCACELGVKKPAKACFDLAAKHIGIAPSNLLYVGDHYDHDYDGAKAAGWQAYHFRVGESRLPGDILELIDSRKEL